MMQFDLEEVKRIIAENYDWGQSADWTNFHFKELSKAIEAVTGDRISEETLKRIFGKRKVNSENYNPQAFSQITLMKFVECISGNKQKGDRNDPKPTKNQILLRRNVLITIFISLILIAVFLIFLPEGKKEKFQFKCENPRDVSPYTATFKYDVSDVSDSVFSDFGNKEETFLPPGKTMINYFYTLPGDYRVRFYTRKRMLDSLRVIAWSRDWQAGFYPNTKPQLFQYFKNQQFYRQPNFYYATPENLKSEDDDVNLRTWISYKYFSPFQKSLDNLSLETRVENNNSTGSLTCYDAEIILLGDSGTIDFKFTQPKCSRWASLRVSEKFLDGKFNDLSQFTVDMSDWLDVKMTTKGGCCKVYLAEKLIFTQKYDKPLGSLVGVIYQFYGSGKIDYLDLKDQTGKAFYTNEFGTNDQK